MISENSLFEIYGMQLSQRNCGMRISADTISFADWLEIKPGSRVLDIGTGCGILAMICAHKGAGSVCAVEIDLGAASTARENFKNSAFNHLLQLVQDDVLNFASEYQGSFDHIISNPPWYKDSPPASSQARHKARIQVSLRLEDILNVAEKLLNREGRLSLILPQKEHTDLRTCAELRGWWPRQIASLYTSKEKPPKRFFSVWAKGYSATERQDIYR
ncbi:MAG: hypothetical protein RLZZ46_1682 [Bacteroidota bacterium]|jgi:tRNA1Val (adenine37-N6)-methyltransferase